MAAPMPFDAPVTTATLPVSFLDCVFINSLSLCPRYSPLRSQDFAGLIKVEARGPRTKHAGIPEAEIADKIRFPGCSLKKGGVHLGIVKARHRTAIKPERTCGDHEIGPLQTAIAKRRVFDERPIPGKPGARVGVKSKEAKEKLLPCMAPGNVEKTKTAPCRAGAFP